MLAADILNMPMAGENGAPETLKLYVYRVLRDGILKGTYKPGARMNESQLARQMNISRIPVREALFKLEEDGLVRNHARRGMFVTELSDEDVARINGLRVVLEAEALRLCRARATPALRAHLTLLVETMEGWSEGANMDAADLDLEFHRTIWRASDNPYLVQTLESLATVLFAFTALEKVSHDDTHWRLNHHRDLLDFVLGQSHRTAEEAIIDHLSRYYADPAGYSSFSPKGKALDA